MFRPAHLLAAVALAALLTGCSAGALTATSSATPASAGAVAPIEAAAPLGPPEPADGRVAAGATVPTPVSPSAIAGVFCAIHLDNEITAYRATQITQYGVYLTGIAADEIHFNAEMGPKTPDQAAALGKRFTADGQALQTLTKTDNVDVPAEWDDRVQGYCTDPLAAPRTK